MDTLRSLLTHPWTIRLCRLITGVIFVWSGAAKIMDVGGFAEQVHNFRVLPVALENLAAMTLPWIEVVAGLSLLVGYRSRSSAVLSLGLLVVFTAAVGAAVLRGLDIECGCFGTDDASRVGARKLVENGGMIAIAIVASFNRRG